MTRVSAPARLGVLLAAMALATVSWMFSAPPEAAAALAPAQTAWWNVANQPGAPAIPPPNDVNTSKHDLYVQGANGTGGPNPNPVPQPNNAQGAVQALAAIHYFIPDGAAVEKLTLKITGNKPPSAPGVAACIITDPSFRSEDNGPGADVPKYDCGTKADGKPNAAGDALVFTDIGKLVKGGDLLLMLVPGQLDRVVFAQPDANALETSAGVTSSNSTFTAPSSSSFDTAPAPVTDSGSGSTGSSFSAPVPVLAPVGEPPLPAPLPTRTPVLSPRRILAAPPLATSSRIPLSPQQTRLVVGAATLASIAAFAAMALLGPRMTAAGGGSVSAAAGNVRGVGRFARPRTGSAPRIW